jgi:cation diffusion facilitator CzcD-associated flavoprotein CzcO
MRTTTACLTDIAGLDAFTGEVLDTSVWDASYDFTGKRVAVIGTDDRVIRVLPDLVRSARSVKVFQRRPVWIAPRLPWPAAPIARNRLSRRVLARVHLRLAVEDKWMRRRLTPTQSGSAGPRHTTSRYYPALQADNCTLVTWPVYAVTERAVRTAEGIEHLADCIVLATGGVPAAAQIGRARSGRPRATAKETA